MFLHANLIEKRASPLFPVSSGTGRNFRYTHRLYSKGWKTDFPSSQSNQFLTKGLRIEV